MVSTDRVDEWNLKTYDTSIARIHPTRQSWKCIVTRRELPVFPVRCESLLHVDSLSVHQGIRAESIPTFARSDKSWVGEVLTIHDGTYVRACYQLMLDRQCQDACEKHAIYAQREE